MMSNHQAQREVIGAVSKSQTPTAEIITPRLPLDLEGCRKIGEPKPIRLLSVEEVKKLHGDIREGSAHDVKEEVSLLADDLETSPPAVLLMAVDPSSGDSLFHTAMRAQRIDVLSQLRETFPPNNSFTIGSKALFRHTNYEDENILHVATQTGNLDMVIAAYRLFGKDRTLPTETSYPGHVPIEDVTQLPYEGIPHLTFLLSENSRGQTAAELARTAGFNEVYTWLNAMVAKLDPLGQRNNSEKRAEWVSFIAKCYQYQYREVQVEDDELE
jgi:ankyrin repeat protein